MAAPVESPMVPQYRNGTTGHAVQTLEQLLAPRRPSCLDPNIPFTPMLSRSSREASVASPATTNGMWDSPSMSMGQYGRAMSAGVAPPIGKISPPQPFIATASSASGIPRSEAYAPHGIGSILEDPRHTGHSPPSATGDGHTSHGMNYEVAMQSSYHGLPPPNQSSSAAYRPTKHHIRDPSQTSPVYTTSPNMPTGNDILSMTGADTSHMRSNLACISTMDCQVDGPSYNASLDRFTSNPTAASAPPIQM
jgi:hypothetical protein